MKIVQLKLVSHRGIKMSIETIHAVGGCFLGWVFPEFCVCISGGKVQMPWLLNLISTVGFGLLAYR